LRQLDQINAFLDGGPHPIERRFAENLLSKFLAEMDAAQGGEDLVATLLKEKRHANRPTLIYQDDDGSFQTDELSTVNSRQGQIALLQLSGAMMQDDFLSTKGMRSFADDIRKADQNPNIAGIIIEANTGGGELLAGQTLRNTIKDASKPVLVYAHYLASAGVWGTLFADHIMAGGKGSEIGSIGVYVSLNKGFLQAYKERMVSRLQPPKPEKERRLPRPARR
jgi:ClpP class serine protease